MAVNKEDLEYQLSRFEEWVKNADVKIGVLLAFDGIVMATIIKHALNAVFDLRTPLLLLVVYVALIVILAWSIGKALWAIFPRLNHRQEKCSLLYFGDVSRQSLQGYKKSLKNLSAAQYRDEMIAQIHAIAVIADKRMNAFRDSVLLLAVSILIAGGTEVWLRLINL